MRRFLAIGVAIVAAAGGLLAVGTVEAGGGCHGAPTGEAAGDRVSIEGCAFGPTVLRVEPGMTVTFVNDEAIPHTVTGADWGSREQLALGESVAFTFEGEGTYAYSCILHPGMVGAVVVGDGSADDGPVAVSEPADDDRGLPAWGLAAGVALTGMVATGAAGMAIGRRRMG
jgi:plastocyanin